MNIKKIVSGTDAVMFLIGLVLIVVGAILYGKSESLSGWANVTKSKNLEIAGGIVFFAGVVSWIVAYVVGNSRPKSK